MDIENANNFSLRNLDKVNVLLGKNGCGKSFLLKQVEQNMRVREDVGLVRYISPERGGVLIYEAGIDQQIGNDTNWMLNQRRKNQSENFRQQSASLFRRLELLFLRRLEKEHGQDGYIHQNFAVVIERLNSLLDRVNLVRHDQKGFQIVDKASGEEAQPAEISSGEAELISLGIEFLSFASEAAAGKTNLLLTDEPDVHLHPDLQDRLAKFVIEAFVDKPVTLILATHSTALLAGLSDGEVVNTNVAFMRRGDQELFFKPVTDTERSLLPIFGAHPLSNVFNQAPILLVEGEDDERIWQQAVRSSQGQIRTYPCVAGSVERLDEYETEVRSIIESVYDNAQGFSLRDRDIGPEEIEDVGSVVRMRLSCRASENLMLSDEALNLAGFDWQRFQQALENWIGANAAHEYFEEARSFANEGYMRKGHNLKSIRNILIGLMTNKPWEVLVGQAIANLAKNGGGNNDGSLRSFLGEKVCQVLLKLDPI